MFWQAARGGTHPIRHDLRPRELFHVVCLPKT